MNSDYTLMKKKNIYILLLLAPVLFASCKVGKSYVRPEMALPDSLIDFLIDFFSFDAVF
jgi:multidrug efflux system outer membrane protein